MSEEQTKSETVEATKSGDEAHPEFECADPILCVTDMAAAVKYYVDVLGFREEPWGDEHFTSVSRGKAGIYLSTDQGQPGGWVWVGVEDVDRLYAEFTSKGARIRQEPVNHPWALEMLVEDPDGNVLRVGSDARKEEKA